MSKAVKAMVMADLKKRYTGVESACVVDITGLDVKVQESLRAGLRAKSARLEVVKNSLARRALDGGPLAPLGGVLEGPCALVTSSESLIDVAKFLVEAAVKSPELTLKQAIFGGDPQLLTVNDVSKMKTKGETLGELALLVGSPGRAIAGCLGAPQAKIAGCLKALAEKAA